MARPSPQFPQYPNKPHRSGQARIRWKGKDYYLGLFGSKESREKYADLVRDISKRTKDRTKQKPETLTVANVCDLWLASGAKDYRPESREPKMIARALELVRTLHGGDSAAAFGVRGLREVRDAMIERGWCRSHVNRNVVRVRTVWRWAEEGGYVPPGTYHHLRSLRRIGGEKNVKEHPRRRPVEWATVERTLPELSCAVAAMVLVQWHTGARPGEVCRMRLADIDRGGEVWTWKPPHKNQWRGQDRVIPIGPKCQVILASWLEVAAARKREYVFDPGVRRKHRRFTTTAYQRAIHRACEKLGIRPRWSAYQIRHAFRLRITREHGLDAARALMGHSTHAMSAEYASGQDLATAAKTAKLAG